MSRKQHTAEQIIGKLREAEVALASSQTVLEACPSYLFCPPQKSLNSRPMSVGEPDA